MSCVRERAREQRKCRRVFDLHANIVTQHGRRSSLQHALRHTADARGLRLSSTLVVDDDRDNERRSERRARAAIKRRRRRFDPTAAAENGDRRHLWRSAPALSSCGALRIQSTKRVDRRAVDFVVARKPAANSDRAGARRPAATRLDVGARRAARVANSRQARHRARTRHSAYDR